MDVTLCFGRYYYSRSGQAGRAGQPTSASSFQPKTAAPLGRPQPLGALSMVTSGQAGVVILGRTPLAEGPKERMLCTAVLSCSASVSGNNCYWLPRLYPCGQRA